MQTLSLSQKRKIAIEAFLRYWWDQFSDSPVTVAELLPIAEHSQYMYLTGTSERAKLISLGRFLASQAGKADGGFRISKSSIRNGSQLWKLTENPLESTQSKTGVAK